MPEDMKTPDNQNPNKKIHPGAGRRKATPFPKGRQVDTDALAFVAGLLDGREIRKDELIEYLHLIQDAKGHLPAADLVALADITRMAMAEVFEVASFYAHFDIVYEGETPPPAVTVRVCESLSCALAGADKMIAELEEKSGADVRILRAPCMGRCQCAPTAEVGHNHIDNATTDSILTAANAGDTHAKIPAYKNLEAYKAEGGYAVLQDCLSGKRTVEDMIAGLKGSGLRGLGGAGFPTGMKWEFVRKEAGPRMMAVNGDEGEPGTFKDRHYLENSPHQFLEGMLIGAWASEATDCYIYMRDEYPAVLKILADEIAAVEATGMADHVKIHLRRGAGAYICGEESAMLESIEGKRGIPRHKPPYPTQVGLFGLPTLIHNVETLHWVPEIITKGADWFASHGENGRKGLRSFSVSGHVKDPGVKLAPAGITIQALIDDYCGGMKDGHSFKAYLPGGASGGVLPATMNDIPLDFDTLQAHGCF
ncbi:MAG: NAD(P)H-dependent oxidoreductase subunit E, partial [Alphaproteobacteria bacterium]